MPAKAGIRSVSFQCGVFAAAFAVALIAAALAPCRASALPLLERAYTMTSDYIMFDIDKKVAYCEGHSEMSYGLIRIQAQKLRVDAHTHVLYAEGNVTIETMARRIDPSGKPAPTGNMVTFNAATMTTVNQMEEKEKSDEQDRTIVENIKQSNIQTFEGDVLYFDLINYAGMITKTKNEVTRTYLLGDSLDVVARMPSITEPEYLFEEPEPMTNAWTAKRLRINPGNFFEGWQTMLWFKGNKVIPTNVPYYTNTSKSITPGKLRLKTVRYSSNNNWNVGAQYKYSESKLKPGTISLDYSGKGEQAYRATLNQAFRLTKNISGAAGIGNMFTSNGSYSLSMNRNSGGSRFQSFSANLNPGGKKYFSMNDNRNFFGTRMTGNLSFSDDKTDGRRNAAVKMLMNLTHKTKYIGPGKKMGMRMNSSMGFDKSSAKDEDANFFVGVSMFRSAKKINPKTTMSSSYNLGYGMHSEGYSNDSYSAVMNMNRAIGKSKSIGFSYSLGQSTSRGNPKASQSATLSYSIAKNDLTFQLKNVYNVRTNDIGSVSSNLSYNMNKRATIWNDLNYDLKNGKFSMKNIRLKYNLYGSDINTAWFIESNDFSIDLSSRF